MTDRREEDLSNEIVELTDQQMRFFLRLWESPERTGFAGIDESGIAGQLNTKKYIFKIGKIGSRQRWVTAWLNNQNIALMRELVNISK